MAMISCPECGKQISDKAAACPNCGYSGTAAKVPTQAAPGTAAQSGSGAIAFLMFAGVVFWGFVLFIGFALLNYDGGVQNADSPLSLSTVTESQLKEGVCIEGSFDEVMAQFASSSNGTAYYAVRLDKDRIIIGLALKDAGYIQMADELTMKYQHWILSGIDSVLPGGNNYSPLPNQKYVVRRMGNDAYNYLKECSGNIKGMNESDMRQLVLEPYSDKSETMTGIAVVAIAAGAIGAAVNLIKLIVALASKK